MKKIRIKPRSISKILLIIIATFFFWLYTQSAPETEISTKDVIKVNKVIDGDTVELNTGERVRYIGMDTPEIDYKNGKDDCFAQQAKQANEKLVLNKIVRMQKDVSNTDKYDRLLRYVFVRYQGKEIMVNEYLVEQGFAVLATYPPDVKYVERFKAAQTQARQNNRGLWKDCL